MNNFIKLLTISNTNEVTLYIHREKVLCIQSKGFPASDELIEKNKALKKFQDI